MSDQVSALNETTQKTIVDMKNTSATLETDGYQVEGNTVYLYLGTNYSFDEMDGINIVFKAPGNNSFPLYGNICPSAVVLKFFFVITHPL